MTVLNGSTVLHRWRSDERGWRQAAPAGDEVVGLLYTPDAVVAVRRTAQGWEPEPGSGTLDDHSPFEARIWTATWDLHWVEDVPGSGLGTARLLSEDPAWGPDGSTHEELPVTAVIDHTYLVWGSVDSVGQGWCDTSSARVGSVQIPYGGAGIGDRVALQAREYLGVVGAHGLCGPIGERLMGFESVGPDATRTEGES